MSENINIENTSGAPDGVHASKPGSEPLTTHGHQPGRVVSEADGAPEFHLETMPAGSAPADKTFAPQNDADAPATGADASSTLGGASSKDVHTGLGAPGQGQSSAELHHDGKSHRANERSGLEGLSGASKHVDTQ